MSKSSCNVCGESFKEPFFRSGGQVSITTLRKFYEGETIVYFCDDCGHLQTQELANLEAYYADSYKLLIESDEEDELYKVHGDQVQFRIQHQVETLIRKVDMSRHRVALDFGCGKGSGFSAVKKQVDGFVPHFFDVSEDYRPFWERSTTRENCAVFDIPASWQKKFELVTSFFSLEHVPNPVKVLTQIRGLLKPDGIFYFIVPCVYTNHAEMVVVDHINHFSSASIGYLLQKTGFKALEIDSTSHDGAVIVTAIPVDPIQTPKTDPDAIRDLKAQASQIAQYWRDIGDRIRSFESGHAGGKVGIYGAGFYGTYLASCLKHPEKIVGFFDRDPHKLGKTLVDKPIIAPKDADPAISAIYVALNPRIAAECIDQIPEWKGRKLDFFFP